MDLSKSQTYQGVQNLNSNSDLFVQNVGFLYSTKSAQEASPGCCVLGYGDKQTSCGKLFLNWFKRTARKKGEGLF